MAVPAVLLPSENRARTATLSLATGAASPSHPLANISSGDVTLPFIASAAGAVRVVFDCATAVLVDGVFLPMYNIPAAHAGVKFEGHSSSSWGAPTVSVDLTIPTYRSRGTSLLPCPEPFGVDLRELASAATRTLRYWSLLVPTFASALAIGECLFGPLTDLWGFSPDDNIEQDEQLDIVKESAFGSRWGFRYGIERMRLGGSLIVMGDERDAFRSLYREVGAVDPFIWMPYPGEADTGLLVTFAQPISQKHLAPPTDTVDSVHSIRVDLLEVGRGLPL